ncbi:MAG: tryptophan synthase subunit alpha [Spirochaetes bacterium]|nr:tryptophan synthase subunit alpha [Spirochaetota bacterium]
MSKKIDDAINNILKTKKIGLMGHIIADFPDYKNSLEAALGICEAGTDFLEVQFPFSDPTADGPTIESACYEAINKGFTIDNGFKLVKELAAKTSTIILIMTYANIIYKYGIEKFVKKGAEIGIGGLIIPDIAIDKDEGLNKICKNNNIANILIAAPGTSDKRIKELSKKGDGFLYTVLRRGITGKKSEINKDAQNWLGLVKKNSSLPIAVGFGIQSSEQVKQLIKFCEIIVVGSHFVRIIRDSYEKKENLREKLCEATKKLLL